MTADDVRDDAFGDGAAPAAGSGDDAFAAVVESVITRLEAGELSGVDDCVAFHPEHSGRLRALWPAIRAMADLGGSAGAGSAAPSDGVGPAEPPLVGTLGDFRLLREIGRGGMGVVYEAEQISLRRVALKTLPTAGLLDERRLQRFRNEAAAAASLHHPNVVPVHSVGRDRGVHYYAMQLIDGPSLAEVIRDTRREVGLGPAADGPSGAGGSKGASRSAAGPAADAPTAPAAGASTAGASTERPARRRERHRAAAALILQAAEALDYAHSVGVVHRDVKPSNLLLDGRGRLWVADFGLAQLEAGGGPTLTGDLVGTLRYMSPEQAEGRPGLADARSDLYSLGVTLYELLTLVPAFPEADRRALLRAVIERDPPPPRRVDPSVPRDLERVVLKATAKEPSARYRSAAEFAADLRRFLAGEPVLARRPGAAARLATWARRNKAAAAAAAVIAATLVAGSAVSLRYAARAEAAAAEARASERLARRLLFASDMRQAADAVADGDPRRAAELLDGHRAERAGPYAFVWNHLDRLARAPGDAVDRLDGPAYFACFSPDGGTLAACGAAGEIRFYAADGDTAAGWVPAGRIAAGQGELNGLAFSPDGRTLASAGDDGTVVLWDLATRKAAWRTKVYGRQAYQVAFGLGGRVLAACGNDPRLKLLDPSTGAVSADLAGDTTRVEAVAVAPDGGTLLSAGYDGQIHCWDLAARALRWWYDEPGLHDRLKSVALSPDGRLAAFGSVHSKVLVTDVATGSKRTWSPLPAARPTADGVGLQAVAFAADGTLVAASDAGTVHLASASEAGLAPAPAARSAWAAAEARIHHVAASPDGSLVCASADGSVVRWRPADEEAWSVVPVAGPGAEEVAVVDPPGRASRFAAACGTEIRLIGSNGRATMLTRGAAAWGAVAADPHRGRLFVGGEDGRLEAWDVAGTPRRVWSRDAGATVSSLAVSPDGSRLAAQLSSRPAGAPTFRTDFALAVFDAATGRPGTRRGMPEWASPPAFSPDGRTVACARGHGVALFDAGTLEPRGRLDGHSDVVDAAAFSPDGRLLASGGRDRRVVLWDVASMREVRSWHTGPGDVGSVAFSADGRLLLTATEDRPPRLWDAETGRLLAEPGGLPGDARGGSPGWWPASFTPDGSRVVAGRGRAVVLLDGRPTGPVT